MKLYEKYRPKTLDEIIGQEKAMASINKVLKLEGDAGQSWYISGPTGTGKTSCALCLARRVAPEYQIHQLNAGTMTLDDLREIEHKAGFKAISGKGSAWIIDEAHLLSKRLVSSFLGLTEMIAEKGRDVIIFTSSWENEGSIFEENMDGTPLAGRCNMIHFTSRGFADAVEKRLVEIAKEENMEFSPEMAKKILIKLGKDKKRSASSIRDAIQEMVAA